MDKNVEGEHMLKYIRAKMDDADRVYDLVQETIRVVYPKYYPTEVVDFFCEHHCMDNIVRDIKDGCVGLLYDGDALVGTGSRRCEHITRVYVLPKMQKQGYGSFIMKCLEEEICKEYPIAYLDASLPASHLYEKLGYQTTRHDKWNVENGVVLVYEVMQKGLNHGAGEMNYDGKVFVPRSNTENGEVDGQTVFTYHHKENILWAEYEGGEIVKGHLLGTVAEDGKLDFHYQHLNVNGQMRIGRCHSTPRILENGKIQLDEEWQWLNGDNSQGKSVLVEK